MPKFDRIVPHERRFRAFTGRDTAICTDCWPHFTLAMERYRNHPTIAGSLRDGARAIPDTNRPLPTPADRRLCRLPSLTQTAIPAVHGQRCAMRPSNGRTWVRRLLDSLHTALASQRVRPARPAAAVAAQVPAATADRDPKAPPCCAMRARNDREHDRKPPMNRTATPGANSKTLP